MPFLHFQGLQDGDISKELTPLQYFLQYMAERVCKCEPISQLVPSHGVCKSDI